MSVVTLLWVSLSYLPFQISRVNDKSKLVWWSIHSAPRSLPCIRFSEYRISNSRASSQALQKFILSSNWVRVNPLILQAEQNIYRSSQLSGFRILLRNICWSNHNFFRNFFFHTCIDLTHHGVTIVPYSQHYTSFISNSTSCLHILGVSHISR